MAIQIPQYQDKLTPSGFVNSQASGVEVSENTGKAMQQLGAAGMHAAGVFGHIEDANAVANQAKPLSDADLYWTDKLKNLPGQMVDGGNIKLDDGSYKPATEKMMEDYDQWSSNFVSGIANPKARVAAQQHLMALRTTTLKSSLVMEAQANVANRSAKVDEAVENWKSVAKNPPEGLNAVDYVGQLTTAAKTMIANSGFDEHTRNTKALQATQQIIESAVEGAVLRNPSAAKAALYDRYGRDANLNDEQIKLLQEGQPITPSGQPAGGAPAAIDGAAPVQIEGADLPAGMRNKNPFNIKYVGQKNAVGPSENRDQGDPQAVYATHENGMEAGFKLMLKKFDGGRQTVYDLIAKQGGWTPGNPQAAQNVANAMGVGVNDKINLRDPDTLVKFGRALLNQEQGKAAASKYSDDMLASVANATLSGKALAYAPANKVASNDTGTLPGMTVTPGYKPTPVDPQTKALVDMLPADKVLPFIHAATSESNRVQSMLEAKLNAREADDMTLASQGKPVAKPLTKEDYIAADPVKGLQRYNEYEKNLQLGTQIGAFATATPEQMQAIIDSHATDTNAPGYTMEVKRKDMLIEARNRVTQERAKDPIAYAKAHNLAPVKPIDWNNMPETFVELKNRVGVGKTMQQRYGTEFNVLTEQEAANLRAGFDRSSTDEKLNYLSALRSTVTDNAAYENVINKIVPDSPVTATAGWVMNQTAPMVMKGGLMSADKTYDPKIVARRLIEGEAILNPTKFDKGRDGKGGGSGVILPNDNAFEKAFYDQMHDAFAGRPAAAKYGMQSVKAYYVAEMSRLGKNNDPLAIDTDVLKEAMTAVTGGATNVNGKYLLRPWGMDETSFKDGLAKSFNDTMKSRGMTDSFGSVKFTQIGDGIYQAFNGVTPLKDTHGGLVYVSPNGKLPQQTEAPTIATTPDKTKSDRNGTLKTK